MLTLRRGVVGVVAVLLVSGILAAGCGGSEGGNPTAPTPAPSTTQAPPSVTTSGLFTFSFSAGMSLAEQDLIRNTILSGSTFFQTSMGRTIQQPTTYRRRRYDLQGANAIAGSRSSHQVGIAIPVARRR